jgi:hypothetical protein
MKGVFPLPPRTSSLKPLRIKVLPFSWKKIKVPDDSTVWKWMKNLSKNTILTLYQFSRPLKSVGSSLWVSIDEHVVPRWSQVFELAKTHHPTRGRKMRADKLFYAYELTKNLLLSLMVSPGNRKLSSFLSYGKRDSISIRCQTLAHYL